MNTYPGKILIVDDEENIRKGLRAVLTREGHQVREVGRPDQALALLETFDCEAAVVDIRMPGMSGTELLSQIRQRWPHISVVLLTGHGTLETAMTAVKEGAHDYLLKPASPDTIRQVVATALAKARRRQEQGHLMDSLRASLRRLDGLPATPPFSQTGSTDETDEITVGNLHIDLRAHEVDQNGDPISLTPSEYDLLLTLASRPGEVVDYVTLVRLALDYEAELWEAKELIKRHVFSLRQKIEPDPASPQYVLNVRGVGYRFARDEAD